MEKIKQPRHVRRQLGSILLVAAVFVTLLAATAFATGAAQSWIGSLLEGRHYQEPDEAMRQEKPELAEYYEDLKEAQAAYREMGEHSDKEERSETLAQYDASRFTLSESYYDGERLVLAYSLEAASYPIELGFGPEDEHFADLWDITQYGGSLLQIAHDHNLSLSDVAQLEAAKLRDGHVGFVVRELGVGDHVTLADGTELGPMTGGEVDGTVVIEPQNGLPEAARNRDALEVVFQVKLYEYYYWLEGDQVYVTCPVAEGTPVTLPVPRT